MIKRSLDIVVAGSALVVASPIIAVVGAAVAVFLGRPVLFEQPRPGLDGKAFVLRKFRSMSDARDADGALLPGHLRVGRFGRLLRSTSLDELPTLWNVVRGDMSLVGPRPLRMEYLPRYSPEQARRHEVRPGITGWAQVNGRNALSWEEKFALDVWYVDHRSLSLDLKILVLTVMTVLRRDGIDATETPDVQPFLGETAPEAEGRSLRPGASDQLATGTRSDSR